MYFTYSATDRQGSKRTGKINVPHKMAAVATLSGRGFTRISVKPLTSGGAVSEEDSGGSDYNMRNILQLGPSTEELYMFFLELRSFISTPYPLPKGLEIIGESVKNKKLKEATQRMQDSVNRGTPLSEAIRNESVFPAFCAELIYAGEESSKITEVMEEMIKFFSIEYELDSEMNKSFVNILIVGIMAVFSIYLVTQSILPLILNMISEQAVDLPMSTQTLLAFAQFSETYGFIVYPVLLVGLPTLIRFVTKNYKTELDLLRLYCPLYKDYHRFQMTYMFVTIFNLLKKGGLQSTPAVKIMSQVVPNEHFKRSLDEAVQGMSELGLGLKESLEANDKHQFLQRKALVLIGVGENTGTTTETLDSVAAIYEKQLLYYVKQNTRFIQIVFLIPTGLVIFWIISAFYDAQAIVLNAVA